MRAWKMRLFLAAMVFSGILVLTTGSAMASGFQLTEKGMKGLGNAYAGGAASADDASTVYWNPAGMTLLDDNEVDVGLFMVRPYFKFDDKGTTNNNPALLGGPQPIPGGNGGDAGGYKWVPNLFWSQKLGDQLNVGLGIVSPFGLGTEYDDDWVGRYHSIKSQVTTIDINPSVAYRINDMFSVGGGVSLQYLDAELTQAIDFGLVAAGPPTFATPSDPFNDGKAELTGDSWGLGWNLGVMFELSEMSRFGLSYRSQVSHTIEGESKISDPDNPALAPLVDVAFGSNKVDAEADIDFPAAVSLSGYHRFGDWAVMGDITWTEWSSLDELRIDFEGPADDSVTTFDWDDSFAYSVGANWYPTEEWTVRTGLRYDESPIPNAEKRSPRVPDEDRLWFALGGTYAFNQSWSLDFGGTYIWVLDDPEIDKPNTDDPDDENFTRGALKGTYDAYSYILGLQVNFAY